MPKSKASGSTFIVSPRQFEWLYASERRNTRLVEQHAE